MSLYGWLFFFIGATFWNIFAFHDAALGCWRWMNLGLAILFSLAAGLFVTVAIGNLLNGCGPWAPAVVEFHQGMTLCPGQTAKGFIIVPEADLIHSPLHPKIPRI